MIRSFDCNGKKHILLLHILLLYCILKSNRLLSLMLHFSKLQNFTFSVAKWCTGFMSEIQYEVSIRMARRANRCGSIPTASYI